MTVCETLILVTNLLHLLLGQHNVLSYIIDKQSAVTGPEIGDHVAESI